MRPDYEAYAQMGSKYEEDANFVTEISIELADATLVGSGSSRVSREAW